jgi:hypothetical protein
MTTNITLPRTKKEACDQLRKIIHMGAIITVRQVHHLGERDRMLTFTTVNGTNIDILVARILNLPLEEVPGQAGVYACRAADTGDGVGPGLVGAIAHKLYRNVFALRCQMA